MIDTLIIGKNSNLSKHLCEKIPNSHLISSRVILENIEILSCHKNKSINIIFNNFQTSTELNNLKNCSKYIRNSILTTSIVLEYFNVKHINKVIYTSSASVYGNNILCKESDELKPMNLHASLKVSNEKLIEKYCVDNNIDYSIARIFNMYGGDDKFSVISKIINAHIKKQKMTIVNNGNAIRDFIHIDDVVSIYLNLLDSKDIKILNIGTGVGNSIKNMLDFLSNNKIEIIIDNIFRDELKVSTSDNQLLYKKTQTSDFVDVEDYLKDKLSL